VCNHTPDYNVQHIPGRITLVAMASVAKMKAPCQPVIVVSGLLHLTGRLWGLVKQNPANNTKCLCHRPWWGWIWQMEAKRHPTGKKKLAWSPGCHSETTIRSYPASTKSPERAVAGTIVTHRMNLTQRTLPSPQKVTLPTSGICQPTCLMATWRQLTTL